MTVNAKATPGKPFGAKTRFPGLGRDAAALGVNWRHLRYVLTGERPSPLLVAKYHALKQKQNASGPYSADPASLPNRGPAGKANVPQPRKNVKPTPANSNPHIP